MVGTVFALIGTAIFLIVALCTFYLGYKQLFGDDNEK